MEYKENFSLVSKIYFLSLPGFRHTDYMGLCLKYNQPGNQIQNIEEQKAHLFFLHRGVKNIGVQQDDNVFIRELFGHELLEFRRAGFSGKAEFRALLRVSPAEP